MVDISALVVEHHVLHFHNDGAVAVVRGKLEGLIGFLVIVQFGDIQ